GRRRVVAGGERERGGEGGGERLWITEPGDDAGLVADQLLRRTIVGDDDRGAARQRLDERHPEGIGLGREDGHPCPGVAVGLLVGLTEVEERRARARLRRRSEERRVGIECENGAALL